MFRIPNYFQMNMTWDEAVLTIKGRGNGDLLAGMEAMNEVWDEHCAECVDDDSDFYEHWIYEINAYNIVFEGMSKLFKEAA